MAENINIPELMGRLHRIHRQLNELNYRLQKSQKMIELQKLNRQKLDVKLQELKENHNDFLIDVKHKETLLQSGEDNLKRRRSQLDAAQNNKEYQSLKEQIESDESVVNQLTDDVLDAMNVVDNSTEKIRSVEKEIEELDQKIKTILEKFDKEKPVIENDIVVFSEKLNEAENELPRDFHKIYLHLKKNLGGENSLAPIVNEIYCGNCNQQIPTPFIAEICGGKPIICQACGRLLYLPEGFVFH